MRRDVKPKRPYDSDRRRDQSHRTRRTVLAAARRLFLTDGYARTTVSAIAGVAGVSVETVYKAYGNKPGLVRAIWEEGLAGIGDIPAERRSDAMQAAEQDPRRVIRGWGALSVEVSPLVVPTLLLVRAAADTDPQMAALLADADAQRLRRMTANARTLVERGDVRTGVTLEEARDLLWTCSSPELYELFVLRRGWSPDRFATYITELMIAALLPPVA